MIRVLLMAQELTQGGSERQLCVTAVNLDRNRFEPHVGCFRSTGLRLEELKHAGVPVTVFPFASFARPAVLKAGLAIGRYIEHHHIQIVHTFDTPANVLGVPVARAFRTPAVVSSQRAFRSLAPFPFRHLLRVTDQLADAIVVNCGALARHLVDDEKTAREKVRLCYNGIDNSVFSPGPVVPSPALSGASLVIGVICALRPEKGLPTLVEAFALASRGHAGWRLLFVGNGPMRDPLRRQAESLGIAAQCIFEPATSDVVPWLRSIHIFVLPSLSEAFSNSIMEASACGCAVIASRVGGTPELALDGETALLFEPRDAAGLALRIERLGADPALRQRLGENARAFISERFSIDSSTRRMESIYHEILPSL